MTDSTIVDMHALGFQWHTRDPFLFCVHHDDAYPAGDDRLGPAGSLAGRRIGQDFAGKDGFSMYHGTHVPGFPGHPHRGFETVTVVRSGVIDHADSLGAAARYGAGDVQWLTTGKGIVHSEMFPLLERDRPNPLELFQIWLNLPSESKLADPHFAMFWRDAVPSHVARDASGKITRVQIIAGRLGTQRAPTPPPDSWASRPDADLAIWTLDLEPGARFSLPPAASSSHRDLYFFRGGELRIDGGAVAVGHGIELRADVPATLDNGAERAELLLLQGRPIGEPVAQNGPFVMNTRAEIEQAFADYQRTRFGGWPWQSDDPVHARDQRRFARHADGRIERAPE